MRRPITRSPSTSRPAIRGARGARIAGSVPNAEANAARCISLPMFPELTAEEVDYVIAKVKEWDKANAESAAASSRRSATPQPVGAP